MFFTVRYTEDVETSYLLKAKLKAMDDGTFVQLESFRSYPPKFGETKIFASDLVPGNAVLSEYLISSRLDESYQDM